MSALTKVVIWGASSHALVVADVLREQGGTEIIGFIDDVATERHGENFAGSKVYGRNDAFEHFRAMGIENMFVAIGNNSARRKIGQRAKEAGFNLIKAVHPHASIAKDVIIGEGTLVCAGCVIGPAVIIGNHVVLNVSAVMNHQTQIEDGAHVSSCVCLAGLVHIGIESHIEIGAVIARGVKVGNHTVVGASSLVLKDLPPNVVAFGSPALVMRAKS